MLAICSGDAPPVIHVEEIFIDDLPYTITVVGLPDGLDVGWWCEHCQDGGSHKAPSSTIEGAIGFARIKINTHHVTVHQKSS